MTLRDRSPSLAAVAFLVFCTAGLLKAPVVRAQEPDAPSSEAPAERPKKAESPLNLLSVAVTPDSPTAETLCRLALELTNMGDRPVSALRFEVEVGGVSLPVYGNQLFMERIDAGEGEPASTEVQLYNFWASETGRPAPVNGKLPVKVTLVEARWLSVSSEEDGTEVWELGEMVPGLPASAERTLSLAGASSAPSSPAGD